MTFANSPAPTITYFPMSPNRRIFLNIVATYGRSLANICLGLFTTRWVLAALGQENYGLYGVVGGMVLFISFFNSILATAVGRFYAYSIGAASVASDKKKALEECRQWFNTAFFLHALTPVVLLSIGYPLGVYAIKNWLTIPPEKIADCVWVWRFACVTCFVGMVNVPFGAMYSAKQEIAELTIYSFAQTIANFLLGFYMVGHPSESWLVKYSFFCCIVACTPSVFIIGRALVVYPECRILPRYFVDKNRIKQIGTFAGWKAFGVLGSIIRGQGLMIVCNKAFGSRVNAAMSVANYVNAGTSTLSAAMQGAFSPAITNACGAGRFDYMRAMAFRACKFGMALILVFSIPLMIEIQEIMVLWLKVPPEHSILLSFAMMIWLVLDKSTIGHMIAVSANGEIAQYQAFLGTSLILTLPVAVLLIYLGLGVAGIAVAIVAMGAICSFGRLFFARRLVGMHVKEWFSIVMNPVTMVVIITLFVGLLPKVLMHRSFIRLCLTVICCEAAYLPACWYIVLDMDEKRFVITRFKKLVGMFNA